MDPRYPRGGPSALGLGRSVDRAHRSPFFSRKLEKAGVGPDVADWDAWLRIPPTTKEELRALASFEDEVCIAPRSDVLEFWRSGGVTGRPLFYPKTAADMEENLTSFCRTVAFAGLSRDDTLMSSFPLGIHPVGHMMARAAERLGAATVWAGAGNQTPSATQIELIHELGVTAWCGMASFGVHLGHLAEAAGRPLAASRVHTLMTSAEPLSPAKRATLSELWGARVVDLFGMTEISMMGSECGRRPGLHIWRDHSFCEVVDPETFEPVPAGQVGVLCATPVTGNAAAPFIRWISGDVVRLEFGCDCAAGDHPRLVHSGRTAAFFKVKGVNLNHLEVEEALYRVPDLRDFRVTVTGDDRLKVEVEPGGRGDDVREAVERLFVGQFSLRPDVVIQERGTIARSLEGQIKAQRFVDERASS